MDLKRALSAARISSHTYKKTPCSIGQCPSYFDVIFSLHFVLTCVLPILTAERSISSATRSFSTAPLTSPSAGGVGGFEVALVAPSLSPLAAARRWNLRQNSEYPMLSGKPFL